MATQDDILTDEEVEEFGVVVRAMKFVVENAAHPKQIASLLFAAAESLLVAVDDNKDINANELLEDLRGLPLEEKAVRVVRHFKEG